MNIYGLVLFGLFVISLILYFVFTFGIKINLAEKITSSAMLPLLGIFSIISLMYFVPDSYHIIKITIFAFLFISASHIIKTFFSSDKLYLASSILFLLTALDWAIFYKSVFLINRVAPWITIISIIAYAVIYLLLFLLFVKKQSLKFYAFSIIALILCSFIQFSSIVSLCFTPSSFNILKVIGSTLFLGYIVVELLNNSIINLKYKKLISFLILLASQSLLTLSNIIIFY